MEAKRAVELLRELIETETQVVHQVNTHRGLTKTASKRERRAVDAIFRELVGTVTTDEEFKEIAQ